MLLEEGIEAVMDIVLEIAVGRYLGKDLLDDRLMVVKDLVQGVGLEAVARHQIDELAEREASQVVRLNYTIELGVLVLQSHHARTGEHNLQVGVQVVALAEFAAPVGLLKHLIDKQYAAAVLVEVASKVGYALTLKIKVVHIDIQTLLVHDIKILLGVLK